MSAPVNAPVTARRVVIELATVIAFTGLFMLLLINQLGLTASHWVIALMPFTIAVVAGCVLLFRMRGISDAEQIDRDFHHSLADIVRSTTNAVILTDQSGRITWVNEGFTRITGYTPDEATGEKPGDLLQCERTDPRMIRGMGEAIRSQEPFRGTLLNRSKQGNDYWIELEITPRFDHRGELAGYMAIQSDITERIQAQQRAEEAVRMSTTLRATMDKHTLFSITDARGKIIDVNEGFCTISGYSREELIGQDHRMLNSGHHPRSFWTEMWRTISGGKAWRAEVCNRAKDGSLYWVDSTNIPQFGPDGKIQNFTSLRFDITAAKSASVSLRRTQELLNKTNELANVGGWELDMLTKEVTWTDEVYRIHELELGNQPPLEDAINFYAPEARPIIRGAVEEGLATGKSWALELPLITAKGNRRWVRTIGAPFFVDGQCVKLTGAFQDITDQREAIVRMAQAESRLSMTIKASNIGLWDWNVVTNETYFSDTYYTMLGYEPGELPMCLETWTELSHPEDRDKLLERVRQYFDGETDSYVNEHRLRKKDGSWAWVRAAGEVVERDEDGNPTRMMGVHVDIDQLRKFNRALEQVVEMERKPSIQETTTELCRHIVGLFNVDFAAVVELPDGERSAEAYVIGGVLRGDAVSGIRYTVDGTPCQDAIKQTFIHVEDSVIERYPQDVMLNEMNMHSYASVRLQDSRGTTVGLLLMMHSDLMPRAINIEATMRIFGARAAAEIERQSIERGLQHAVYETEAANRAKSEFLANMSHEIRTPMTAILGYVDLITDPQMDSVRLLEHAATIKRNADHLMTILNDILDVSKIEAGRFEIEYLETNLIELMTDIGLLIEPRALEKGLIFEIVYESPVPPLISTDPTRLRQILLNFITNALKFTERGSITLRVAVGSDPQQLTLCVEDTGIGMTGAQCDTIARFDAFTQADGSTSRKFGGTGLGLRISNMLAELLGGTIEIQSDHGKGSAFMLSVPLRECAGNHRVQPDGFVSGSGTSPRPQIDKPQAALPAQSTPCSPLAGVRIMVAEDGADNQRLISHHLTRAGADVDLASNGREAIEQARGSAQPDLILMDMQMPEIDGYEATRALRSSGWSKPIIALTAHAMADDRAKCMQAGCNEYLTKPINQRQLIEACIRFVTPGRNDTPDSRQSAA